MPFKVPLWPFNKRPPLKPSFAHLLNTELDDYAEGYIDMEDAVTGLSPSERRNMENCIAAQQAAEYRPQIARSISVRSVAKSFRSLIQGQESMDAEILKDPVKQHEVSEKTGYADISRRARAQRMSCLGVRDAMQITETVRYTGNEEADRKFEAEAARRSWEMRVRFAQESGYDDCFVKYNPDGWVSVEEVKPSAANAETETDEPVDGSPENIKQNIGQWMGEYGG